MNIQKEVIRKLKKDNFVVIKSFFNKSTLKKVKDEFTRIEKKITNKRDRHYIVQNSENRTLSSLHNIHLYSNFYKKLIKESGLNQIVFYLYGSKSNRIFNSSFFAKPNTVGVATKIHQDNAFFNLKKGEALTCWVALDDSNKKNGGMFYYRGSSKLGDLEHTPQGNLGASMTVLKNKDFFKKIKKYKKSYVSVKAGDCIIHNALVVHGSSKNVSRANRRAFNFSIASKDKVDRKKLNVYKEKLRNFLNEKK